MKQYVLSFNPPSDLSSNEMVLGRDNFLPEIQKVKLQFNDKTLTNASLLKAIVENVAQKYDQPQMALKIRFPLYEGVHYDSYYSLSKILCSLFDNEYPQIFDISFAYHLRNRPENINFVYYSGGVNDAVRIFRDYGFDKLTDKTNKNKNAKN